MAEKIHGRNKDVAEFIRKLGFDPDLTRRVIVDLNVDAAVRVYIEGYGDAAAFRIEPPTALKEAEIIRVSEANG